MVTYVTNFVTPLTYISRSFCPWEMVRMVNSVNISSNENLPAYESVRKYRLVFKLWRGRNHKIIILVSLTNGKQIEHTKIAIVGQ